MENGKQDFIPFLLGQKSITGLLLTRREAGKCTLTRFPGGTGSRFCRESMWLESHMIPPPYIPSSLGFIYKDESFFLFAAPEILLFKDALVRNEMSHLIANSPIASIANCYWWATKRGMIKRIKRFPDNKGCIVMSLKTVSFFSWAILSLFRTWKYLLGIAFNAKEIQKILQYRVIVNQTLHL